MPGNLFKDSAGKARLMTQPISFSQAFNSGINQIRQNAGSNVAVSIRLMDMLIALAAQVESKEVQDCIKAQFESIRSGFDKSKMQDSDYATLRDRYDRLSESWSG